MSGCVVSIGIICPYCDEDVILNYEDLNQEWQKVTCPECSQSFEVRIDTTNSIQINTG